VLDKAVNFLNNRYFIAVIVLLFLLSIVRSFRRV
jgi:hypothetical protein